MQRLDTPHPPHISELPNVYAHHFQFDNACRNRYRFSRSECPAIFTCKGARFAPGLRRVIVAQSQSQTQGAGKTTVMSTSQIRALNSKWEGVGNNSERNADQNMRSTAESLISSGFVRQNKTTGVGEVEKPIKLADAIVIPVGSQVSGPDFHRGPVDQSSGSITFTLPNGSRIEFQATQQNTSGLGATAVEVFDKKSGTTAKVKFVAAPFFDTKTGALNFLSGPRADTFRMADFRAQANRAETWADTESRRSLSSNAEFNRVLGASGLGKL